MINPATASILGWARQLRHPTLFKLTAALFLIDLCLPDPLPFVDEIIFGLGTLLLANWRTRRTSTPSRRRG